MDLAKLLKTFFEPKHSYKKRGDKMTNNTKVFLAILFAGILVAIIVGAFRAKALEAKPVPKCPETIVFEKLFDNQSEPNLQEINAAFSPCDSTKRSTAIRHVVEDIHDPKVNYEFVHRALLQIGCKYKGDWNNLPPALRSTAVHP
jgi:hypothetical protein